MQVSDKCYPIDLSGVKEIGLEKWLEDYYIPVKGNEIYEIYNKIFDIYATLYLKNHNEIIKRVVLSLRIPLIVSKSLYEVMRLKRLRENGYDFILTNEKIKITDDYIDNQMLKVFSHGALSLNQSGKVKNYLRFFKYNISTSGILNFAFLKNLSTPAFLIGNRFAPEIKAYCDGYSLSPIQIPPMLFGSNHSKSSSNIEEEELKILLDDFWDQIRDKFVFIENRRLELLKNKVKKIFSEAICFFQYNYSILKIIKPQKLLLSGIGSHSHRLFATAWEHAGGKVVGFVHGNGYWSGYDRGSVTDGFLSILDEYVASTAGQEKILKAAIKKFKTDFKTDVIVSTNKINIHKKLFNRLQHNDPVKRISKVMVVGYPLGDYVYINPSESHGLAYLRLEIELVKILKSTGYYVIYKAHPMTQDVGKYLFNEFADEYLTNTFEDVYERADCLLFTYAYSTTLGFSMLTKKPIVVMDVLCVNSNPRVYDLIRKRCMFIDAKPDGAGGIEFDSNQLISSIGKDCKEPNYDILYEYAF